MALTDKLSAIGDAIREKTGKTDLMTLDAMPVEIASITTGGGGEGLPEEALVITGNCQYRFANGGWDWFIENYGNQITMNGTIINVEYMFNASHVERIPFTINLPNSSLSIRYMFQNCDNLKTVPTFGEYVKPTGVSYMFKNCYRLREFPEDFGANWDWSKFDTNTSSYSCEQSSIVTGCYSLRKLPMNLYKHLNPVVGYMYSIYYYMANQCYVLDEIVDLPVYTTVTWTSNSFGYSFNNSSRLKRLTFEMNEDGSPKVVKWKNQTIDLTTFLGWVGSETYITGYNSGITADKKVTDDASYQALKDDSDWYSMNFFYARYNHDSAVETINSLPDASAYLASAGGTNTIKFRSQAGQSTDGGAINTLTEEEIAVATAKGWTVTLV